MISSGYMPRSGIVGSYGGLLPRLLRNCHIIFHSGQINLHFHQQCKSIPFSPHSLQHLLFVDFLMIAILTGMSWYLTVVLICISLICWESFHVFVSHCYVFAFPTFWLGCLFFLYWVVWAACIFLKLILCQLLHLLLFSPILRVVFSPWLYFHCCLYFPKLLQMVTAAMKLKDACSLEEKLWPT